MFTANEGEEVPLSEPESIELKTGMLTQTLLNSQGSAVTFNFNVIA